SQPLGEGESNRSSPLPALGEPGTHGVGGGVRARSCACEFCARLEGNSRSNGVVPGVSESTTRPRPEGRSNARKSQDFEYRRYSPPRTGVPYDFYRARVSSRLSPENL